MLGNRLRPQTTILQKLSHSGGLLKVLPDDEGASSCGSIAEKEVWELLPTPTAAHYSINQQHHSRPSAVGRARFCQ